jgi:hypothetical protein
LEADPVIPPDPGMAMEMFPEIVENPGINFLH